MALCIIFKDMNVLTFGASCTEEDFIYHRIVVVVDADFSCDLPPLAHTHYVKRKGLSIAQQHFLSSMILAEPDTETEDDANAWHHRVVTRINITQKIMSEEFNMLASIMDLGDFNPWRSTDFIPREFDPIVFPETSYVYVLYGPDN